MSANHPCHVSSGTSTYNVVMLTCRAGHLQMPAERLFPMPLGQAVMWPSDSDMAVEGRGELHYGAGKGCIMSFPLQTHQDPQWSPWSPSVLWDLVQAAESHKGYCSHSMLMMLGHGDPGRLTFPDPHKQTLQGMITSPLQRSCSMRAPYSLHWDVFSLHLHLAAKAPLISCILFLTKCFCW